MPGARWLGVPVNDPISLLVAAATFVAGILSAIAAFMALWKEHRMVASGGFFALAATSVVTILIAIWLFARIQLKDPQTQAAGGSPPSVTAAPAGSQPPEARPVKSPANVNGAVEPGPPPPPGAVLVQEAYGVRMQFSHCARTSNTLACEFTLTAISDDVEITLTETINPTGMQSVVVTYAIDLSQHRRALQQFVLTDDRFGRRIDARVIHDANPLRGRVELEPVGSTDDRLPELHVEIGSTARNLATGILFKKIPIR